MSLLRTVSTLGLFVGCVLLPMPAHPASPTGFDETLRLGRRAMRKGRISDARRACRLLRRHEKTQPVRSHRAALFCGPVSMKLGRYAVAARRYRLASLRAQDNHRLRNVLMRLRQRAAEKNKTALEFVKALRTHDRRSQKAIARARKQPEKVLADLVEAESVYRQDRDADRVAWVAALRAKVLIASGQVEEGLTQASRLLSRTQPNWVKKVVLDALSEGHMLTDNLPKAAKAAFEAQALSHEDVPQAKKRYARTKRVNEVCRRYDGVYGRGACARLEGKLTGNFTLTDFSKRRRTRFRSSESMEEVHQQFLPALEDCVLRAAKKDKHRYRGAQIHIAWGVRHDGKTTNIEINPHRYHTDLSPCVTERIAWLRYPKVREKEVKNVVVPYELD